MIVLWNSAEMTVQLTLIDGDKRTDYEWAAERNLARDMLAYLRDRLAENEASFADISGIGVFRGPGSFILSRREVVEAEAAAARAEVFGKLNVGDVVTGKVVRITSFGAFIDLGGVDRRAHV